MEVSKCKVGLLILMCAVGTAETQAYEQLSSEGRFIVSSMNNGQAIITEAMFQGLGATEKEGENINGPSVIRIPDWIAPEHRADPSAIYYLYFAHHDGEYIRMAWAADIAGPWSLYDVGTGVSLGDRGVLDLGGTTMDVGNGIVIPDNHLASPNAHVDDVNQRIILYFHNGPGLTVDGEELTGAQKTFVATSDYGLEFAGNVEPVFLGNSYFAVFHYDGNIYALDNGASIYKARDASNPWTPPSGWDFNADLWLNGGNAYEEDLADDGYDSGDLRVRHTGVWVDGDTLYTFYSRRGVTPPERLMLSVTDLSASSNYEDWDPSYPPEEIYRAQPGWEGGQFEILDSETSAAPENVNQLRDPYPFVDADGSMYLFYAGCGEDALGVVHLEPTGRGLSDFSAPSPASMTWASAPSASGYTSIEMAASTATDTHGVKYYFENLTDPSHDSGWQVSPYYLDIGLEPGSTYTYRVKARDMSANQNENNSSTAASATTLASTFSPVFETFTSDPSSRGWINNGNGNTVFSYNGEGYLNAEIHRDVDNRANYFRPLDTSIDASSEFWMEMDLNIVEESNIQRSFFGVFNSEAPDNQTDFVGSRFAYGVSRDNRMDIYGYSDDGITKKFTSSYIGAGVLENQSVRVKVHYFQENDVGLASLEVYEINAEDGRDGDFIMGTVPKMVIGEGSDLAVNMFGLGNRTDGKDNGSMDTLVDNLYFSTVRANPSPLIPSWLPSQFDQWADLFNVPNTTVDSDLDGVNNLYEFGLGGDPTNPAWSGYLPNAEISASTFNYVYPRREDSGLVYTIETSTNLLSNAWNASGYVELETTGTGSTGFESVTNEISMENDETFVRLIIKEQ
ncbi:hypothetical protein P4E94_17075 [Pontiellaceae bacterium B12219]|nr:hypothetical protein [Pontiellaceae bacterium B12219]